MKRIKLVVLSLAALVFARPAGMCTANTQAEDIAALQEKLAKQEEVIAGLRAAQPIPPPPAEALGATGLLIKGAGVKLEDVDWRIRAGLSPAQAVEVAAAEKLEAEEAAKKSKK